jgi:hypothetical protein
MKLNNLTINLSTKSFEDKPVLKVTNLIENTEKTQSTIYYENGIPEIDKIFNDNKYYLEHYVFRIYSLIDGIKLHFGRYVDNFDIAFIEIHRSDLIGFEEIQDFNLEILKNDEKARKFKKNLGYSFGVAGAVIANVADSNRKIRTKYVKGSRFKLNYHDKDGKQQTITVYSPEEYKHETLLFLNTYYKNELPKDAKVPVKKDSECFIATACYKDIYSPEVVFFRWYRDNILNNSYFGQIFVNIYYKFSPMVYNFIARHNKVGNTIKSILNKMYRHLSTKHGK